jgi:hypothetical protein
VIKLRAWTYLKQPLRTGAAVVLATVTYQLLHLRYGYWVMLSAMVVVQSNLRRSITAGVNRLLATAVGALVGTAVHRLAGTPLIATFLAVTLTMSICSIAPLREGQRLSSERLREHTFGMDHSARGMVRDCYPRLAQVGDPVFQGLGTVAQRRR